MKRQVILIGLAVVAPLLVLAVGLHGLAMAQEPLGTGFTYQGQLMYNGSPISDTCAMTFTLYSDSSSGSPVGSPLNVSGVAVTGGLFTVPLDFGSAVFAGEARWLGIQVDCAAGGAFADLGRQALSAAPYALALPGLWTLQNASSPNLIGGYSGNLISPTVVGAAIGGGGYSGLPNQVSADYGTVGGGAGNRAITNTYATVGGGLRNEASGSYATVGGGRYNQASGYAATIAGGYANTATVGLAAVGGGQGNQTGDYWATVGGGYANTASGNGSTVGGGLQNRASGIHAAVGGGEDNEAGGGNDATVGGGSRNRASGDGAAVGGGEDNAASGNGAAVGGGFNNQASGQGASVPGGAYNVAAGDFSFAAGRGAKADQAGCFVWGDNTGIDLTCAIANAFVVRATGGVTMYTDAFAGEGVTVPPGGNAWSSVSDRALKANVVPADGGGVLARLAQVPVSTWNYITQAPSIRHMGPMAQDFYAAFGLGEDDTHISTVDADGVALAAIQGLYAQNQALAAENAVLRSRLDGLEARLAALEAAAGGDGR